MTMTQKRNKTVENALDELYCIAIKIEKAVVDYNVNIKLTSKILDAQKEIEGVEWEDCVNIMGVEI